MLSQCVQYHNASKFTAGFQHFPFIVLYRYGDTHWSWQIILFIIEHYPMHSIIRFISCPACLRWGIWRDIRVDIKERIFNMIKSTKNTLSEREREREREMVFTFVVLSKNAPSSLADRDWHVLTEKWELIVKVLRIWSRRVSQASWSFTYSKSRSYRQVKQEKRR